MTAPFRSILDCVLSHDPNRSCVRTYSPNKQLAVRTFGEVAVAAQRAAAFYQAQGVQKGDIVILIGTHHVDLYGAWLGAVWLGAIPTLLAEPSVRIDKHIYWARMQKLVERIGAKLLAVDPAYEVNLALPTFSYEAIAQCTKAVPPRAEVTKDDLLLLQHSSGTTGLQKGVMLSHGAVMRHAAAYSKSLALHSDDVVASWLPLYHDMGLIACFVGPLIAGIPVVWLSPFEWVQKPGLLLEAVTTHRATLTWLPNFAFAFLSGRAKDPHRQLNLSSLRAVVNCSEPVSEAAMTAFADRYAAEGLRRDALHTCYAMAENVFAVSASTPEHPARTVSLDAQAWREQHRAVPATQGARLLQTSNGPCLPECEVRIAAADGATLPSGHAGRVLVRSSFLLSGYFHRPDLNDGLLNAEGFYDTGDLGWVDADGHVFITGRAKDLVIIGGRNIYPQDVEELANSIEGVKPGRTVCFGVPLRNMGTEGLVLLVESEAPAETWPTIVAALRSQVPTRLDLDLVDARVLAPATLRKSTSGKLARQDNRETYLRGQLGAVPPFIASTGA